MYALVVSELKNKFKFSSLFLPCTALGKDFERLISKVSAKKLCLLSEILKAGTCFNGKFEGYLKICTNLA